MATLTETTGEDEPMEVVPLNEKDISAIVDKLGGCCSSDPLFAYMLACSPDAKPGLAEAYAADVQDELYRNKANRSKLVKHGGMVRLGSAEDQKEQEKRYLRKRTHSESWEKEPESNGGRG